MGENFCGWPYFVHEPSLFLFLVSSYALLILEVSEGKDLFNIYLCESFIFIVLNLNISLQALSPIYIAEPNG